MHYQKLKIEAYIFKITFNTAACGDMTLKYNKCLEIKNLPYALK